MNQDNKNVNIPNKNSNVDYNHKVLEVKDLKKHFFVGVGKKRLVIPAVDNITFDVYKREVFGLVGESGCGKTTAARTIIKLYNPTEGTVDLNDIRIGAGYLGFKNDIKKVKAETKEKIISLDERSLYIHTLKKELNNEIIILNSEVEKLKKQKEYEIKEEKKVIDIAKDNLYKFNNKLVLAIENIKYNYKLKVTKINNLTLNSALVEYNNELKICKISFERKMEGLKESAALEKETIAKRMAQLHEEYVKHVAELKINFEPLIEAEKAKVLPKNEAKTQIKELKAQAIKDITELKDEAEIGEEKIKKPNLAKIDYYIKQITAKYDDLIKAKIHEIQDKKTAFSNKLSAIPKVILSESEKIAMEEKTNKIMEEHRETIRQIRAKISEAKEVNSSKDTFTAAQKMQMIFQDPISSLNPRMTVKEIVGEGLIIQGKYTSAEISERVGEALKLVGLAPEYEARYPHEFSGGQRQRIGIARALIMNPDFIIADEPISALDVSIRAQVLNLLTDLKERLGLTILFIAHDLSVVRFFCDRIAVMYYGKIVELTTAEELFANPMHPYTISLLSAIPQPDPDYEKGRTRIHYNPAQHDYRLDKPKLREIAPGHLVYANNKEFEEMEKKYKKNTLDQQVTKEAL